MWKKIEHIKTPIPGTIAPGTTYPCPHGTFGQNAGLKSISECTGCTAGKYCNDTALLTPSGECYAGSVHI
eukprot:1350505-Amorphochlora_amoeboformis.AAC.1